MSNPLTEDDRREILAQTAQFLAHIERAAVTRTPSELGLEFEDVSFDTEDGLTLRAWHIPARDSRKLLIFNHFMLANRAGALPNPDWGNVSVDFMPIYKALTEAGYSVLTYDMRNHGASDLYRDGACGLTHWEYRDVLASVRFARDQYPDCDLYLFSQCFGTASTIRAMQKEPDLFAGIKAFVNLQPLSMDAFVEAMSGAMGFGDPGNVALFSEALKRETGFGTEDCRVEDIAAAVQIPTLTVQVRKDWRTTQQSIEDIHANIASDDKTLLWIEDQTERLEGYNHFARNPQELIDWLDAH